MGVYRLNGMFGPNPIRFKSAHRGVMGFLTIIRPDTRVMGFRGE